LFTTESLAEPTVDVTVQGQGETTLAELVERFAEGADLAGVQGIAYRAKGEPVLNPPRPIHDMNSLTAHDYSLIPVERYFGLKKERQFDYISSTGCYFRCAFCADPFVYKRRWVGL